MNRSTIPSRSQHIHVGVNQAEAAAADRAYLMYQITAPVRPGTPCCSVCHNEPMVIESHHKGGRGYVNYHVCPRCRLSQEVRHA